MDFRFWGGGAVASPMISFFAPRGILPHVLRSRSVMTCGEKFFFF